jgi:hypothetical protein
MMGKPEGGKMKYLLMHCVDESVEPTADEIAQDAKMLEAWLDETARRGVRLHGDRLRPERDATTVRVQNGEILVSDGPFAETKEQIGGFDVIPATSRAR